MGSASFAFQCPGSISCTGSYVILMSFLIPMSLITYLKKKRKGGRRPHKGSFIIIILRLFILIWQSDGEKIDENPIRDETIIKINKRWGPSANGRHFLFQNQVSKPLNEIRFVEPNKFRPWPGLAATRSIVRTECFYRFL